MAVRQSKDSIQAVSKRKDIPTLLAMEGMVALIGGSIGSTVAAAMWTGMLPAKLAKYLPADAQKDLTSIYADIKVQSGYAVGSPTRTGINHAYGDAQRLMLIASPCLNVITLAMPMLCEVSMCEVSINRYLVLLDKRGPRRRERYVQRSLVIF